MPEYDDKTQEELVELSQFYKDKVKELQEKRKEIAMVIDKKTLFAKFDRKSDAEKEAMKIYVNSFNSDVNHGHGKVG